MPRIEQQVTKVCFLALAAICSCVATITNVVAQETDVDKAAKFAIVIHGGAGGSPTLFSDQYNAKRQQSMSEALSIGSKILADGGTSLDAVEAVIMYLEDNPQFNAGHGAVFTDQGKIELDASIMVGDKKRCGAVASVTTVRHPIKLARLVMEETRHVLLVREGAETFAQQQGLELVDNEFFWTPNRKRQWERYEKRAQKDPAAKKEAAVNRKSRIVDPFDLPEAAASYRGTVGCVALDKDGNICAGTSTGGLQGKRFGRVGDSPIIGAGTYADNQFAGLSATGTGEEYIRNAACYQVVARMKFANQNLDQAMNAVLNQELKKGDGGLIGLDAQGNVVAKFNTDAMAYAYRDSDGKSEVVWDPKADSASPENK